MSSITGAYYDNFIKAIKDTKQATWDLTQIFTSIASLPNAVRNNAGGYYNHNFFWKCMHPRGMHQPTGKLSQEVDKKFGGYEALKKVDDCRWNGALWLRFCVVDYQFGWQS